MNTLLESSLTLGPMGVVPSCPWQVIGGAPVLVQTIPSIMWATHTTRQLFNVSAGSGPLMGPMLRPKMAQMSSGVAIARAPTGKFTEYGQKVPINVQRSP